MYRKGQNVRFFIKGLITAEETTLTITRGVDTENSQNKDLAADSSQGDIAGEIPVAMYKSMTFQVEAKGVGAKTLFKQALALMTSTGGAVGWADTSGDGNRTGSPAAWVNAICNDLTITAPNRQPVTCSAQFQVIPGTPTTPETVTPAAITTNILRGEFLRLFVGTSTEDKPIALATSCSLHISLSLEDANTKDTTSSQSAQNLDYKAQEPTTLNYDISSDTLYGGNSTAQNIAGLTEGATYKWKLADASGTSQWTAGSTLISGEAMLTSLNTNAAVGQNITHSGTFTGVGVFDDDSSEVTDSDNET